MIYLQFKFRISISSITGASILAMKLLLIACRVIFFMVLHALEFCYARVNRVYLLQDV